jgi:pimeloyl-ACP methyl ester carboxylesterase
VFAFFHDVEDRSRGRQALVICTPFGWGEVSSYRALRDWAIHLAQSGYPTLRMDLPGTGDSGGSPLDPSRLQAWTEATCVAARWVRASTGCPRVAAIGISMGGLVACCSIAAGAPIDELILWAVPSEGRTFVREMRAFAMRQEAGQSDVRFADGAEPGAVAAGFMISADTVKALNDLDLTALAFPEGRPSRALLLQREGIEVDTGLGRCLKQKGVQVTIARGAGYAVMMRDAQGGRVPTGLFVPIEQWLEDSPTDPPAPARVSDLSASEPQACPASASIELSVGGSPIRETPLTIDRPFGKLFGILAEPADDQAVDLCAIFLNAGAIRHIGPNRMWVEAARRWAGRGVRTLRLDLEGLGDADGAWSGALAGLYVQARVSQALAAVEELTASGLCQRVMLVGLCSGAHWSFHGALLDERVVAAVLLNPSTIFWEPSLATLRAFRTRASRSSWRRALRRGVHLSQLAAVAAHLPTAFLELARGSRARSRKLDRALDQLALAGKNVTFAFSNNEPLWQEFKREGRFDREQRRANVVFEVLPGSDHILRPLEAQRRAHATLDRALDRELQRLPG